MLKIVVSAPMRISLMGGSTDLPVFYEKHGGLVISMAINLRQKIKIDMEGYEMVPHLKLFKNANPNFYMKFFEEFDCMPQTLKAISDTPIQSGLGSSASAAVALVASLSRLKGQNLTKKEIAEKAWDIEVNKLGLYGGKQDQYAASCGGFNAYIFSKDEVKIAALDLNPRFWKERIILFYIGNVRKNPKIQEGLKELNPLEEKALELIKINAGLAIEALGKEDVQTISELLKESWEAKKKSNNVTNERIDMVYDEALKSGALAGKLNGSGQGGFMTFLVNPDKQDQVKTALTAIGCTWYDFSLDWNGVETRILP